MQAVLTALYRWCGKYDQSYDIGCDESNIQGIKILQKDKHVLNQLLDYLQPFVAENNVHCDTQRVRGGTIVLLSLEALSESQKTQLVERYGEEIVMTFVDRIEDAFDNTKPKNLSLAEQLQQTAMQLAGKVTSKPDRPKRRTVARKRPKRRFSERIAETFESKPPVKSVVFHTQLREALAGMATSTGAQPNDLFHKFAQALRVLGGQLSIGPLQDRLKEQGINWKKSDDNQAIILYVVNAQTNAPQPIARINAETLESPNDFQEQLMHMLDFAKGDAPGAFQQRQEELRNQDKVIRDVARSVNPQQTDIAKQMGPQQPVQQIQSPAAQPAQAPAQPQTPVAAGQAAAGQAAMPKPSPTMPGATQRL